MQIEKLNALLPDLEALATGLALSCSDSLITFVESGQVVTWHSALLLVAGTVVDYLKRSYHEKRAAVPVPIKSDEGGK
jgi:hypothetical protein